ncbi:hypothetical protein Tco_0011229 [Tanacetum coccineum]
MLLLKIQSSMFHSSISFGKLLLQVHLRIEMEITATIDGRVNTVTEASIRRHLKLEDSDGISTLPNTEILEVHTLGSDEGSMTLNELTVLCTTLSKKVESLESDLKQTKLTYGAAYTKLIMKVKKLENKGRKIAQIDEDEGITLVQMGGHTTNIPVSTTGAEVSTASTEVKTAGVSTVDALDDITFDETLMEIRKSATKPQKEKGIVFKEKPSKKKDQIHIDEELAPRLHAEEQVELERMQRERTAQEEASRAVINEELDSILAMIEADEE